MWPLQCDNPEALRRLFDSMEGLDRVDLQEILLEREGTRLQLRFTLPRFPDHPPARWEADANAVKVTLDLWMVENLVLQGWRHTNAGILALERLPEGLALSFTSADVTLRARCLMARIARLSEYTVSEPDQEDPHVQSEHPVHDR